MIELLTVTDDSEAMAGTSINELMVAGHFDSNAFVFDICLLLLMLDTNVKRPIDLMVVTSKPVLKKSIRQP